MMDKTTEGCKGGWHRGGESGSRETTKNKVYVKTVIMKPNILQDSFEKLKVTIM